MTAAAETTSSVSQERCGCCGRQFERRDVVELGSTPGVFICAGCALFAARRAGAGAAIRQLQFTAIGSLLRRLTTRRRHRGQS